MNGILNGLKEAEKEDLSRVFVISDCVDVALRLNKLKCSLDWRLDDIVAEIHKLCRNFARVTFAHGNRIYVQMADFLATNACTLGTFTVNFMQPDVNIMLRLHELLPGWSSTLSANSVIISELG